MDKKLKKYAIFSVFILVLFLLIFIFLNYLYIEKIEKNKQIFKKQEIYKEFITSENLNNTINFAFFGDSHTANSINLDMINNNSFNFAIGDDNYVETYYILNKILYQDNIKIETIVLEMDLHTFSEKLRVEKNYFKYLIFYSNFLSLEEISNFNKLDYTDLFIKKNFPLIGNGFELRYLIFKPTQTEISNTGFIKVEGSFANMSKNDRIITAQKKVLLHFNKNDTLIENTSFTYFLKIIELCEKNNISVVIISYPISEEYFLSYENMNFNREEYNSYVLAQVDSIYSKNYTYYDHYNIYFNNSNYFKDSDHLNYEGANNYSNYLAKKLEVLN